MKRTIADRVVSEHPDANVAGIIEGFIHHLKYIQGKDQFSATPFDIYLSFAGAIRELLLDKWLRTQPGEYAANHKRIYYLSLEYLIGRSLENAILNLDLQKQSIKALEEMGYQMEIVKELEWDAGLGNGGLGRLAACFMDSLASLKIPAYGYGIRYEFGIFYQHIKNGEQVETPDNWLRYGSIWEIPHPEHLFPVSFGGKVIEHPDQKGKKRLLWQPEEQVMAMAFDYLVPGYKNDYINTLRLWSAKSTRDFQLNYFNEGDYIGAVEQKNHSEIISKVLYPNDNNMQGKELRLKQEYFFVSATIADILRRFFKKSDDLMRLPDKVAIQLNDTHPAVAVAELMRVLVDEKAVPWEKAWEICQGVFAYTNHTILPEALERWQVELFGRLLPRHLQIIYEINQRFLDAIRISGASDDEIKELSLIEEEPVRSVRMANLAIVGSHSINGVSELHSQLLREQVFPHFYRQYPQRFNNKTNGITPRRWLMLANPRLTELINKALGTDWQIKISKLDKLRKFMKDKSFLEELEAVKRVNKQDFAQHLEKVYGWKLNPNTIFDFQAKRIHEYKRQLLNVLHIIHLALRIKSGDYHGIQPHSFFFSGKAAPGYYQAKLIIRLINALGAWIEREKDISKLIKVYFLPNYRVSLAERIMPAAELSQQISLAGTEASGTGNMKFALNGALTVGTLDGANIEMRESVGHEHFYIFGMTADEVAELKAGGYHPYQLMQSSIILREIFEFLGSDRLCPMQPGLFDPIIESLLHKGDQYCLVADLPDYTRVMRDIDELYNDQLAWNRSSLANIIGMRDFSSDETIKRYATDIWGIKLP
ncbi:MAG: glycogen phosphorylase [Candidatus Cloacimonetes bacterium HGW-Cloacimonetes-2]|jgi:starch phosphorylase|nr:MAG: glycogen phosphorylase [Candidatus Cloacimonetes bacterium HGW-Cloacimonetes-2]